MDTLTEYTCLNILPVFPRVGGKPDHVSSQGKEAVFATHDIYLFEKYTQQRDINPCHLWFYIQRILIHGEMGKSMLGFIRKNLHFVQDTPPDMCPECYLNMVHILSEYYPYNCMCHLLLRLSLCLSFFFLLFFI